MRKTRLVSFVCLPAGLCSQDHIYGIHSNSHDIDNCLSSLSVCQAVDTQRLQSGSAASRKEKTKSTQEQTNVCQKIFFVIYYIRK